jgi:multicomponent Na+:H+ antiporter subunit E
MTGLDFWTGGPRGAAWWRALLVRAAVLSVLWYILAEGALRGWAVAAMSIVASLLASMALLPPGQWRLRPLGVMRFIPFFLWHSFRGGLDVAYRALQPRVRIRPDFLDYPLRLPPGPGRTFFGAALGLLPGTLNAEFRDRDLRVHTLAGEASHHAVLGLLEERVADMFGVELVAGPDSAAERGEPAPTRRPSRG